MLKVALVGCGKIADAHVSQIKRIAGCAIVGVCDQEELMARQLAERFGIQCTFDDLTAMVRATSPDVVHVTTPPHTHLQVATRCLQEGCSVFVEKPFTLFAEDAQELIGLADRKGLKLTVGHDDQFRHMARRMRQLVNEGYLGGAPVHMEGHYCYELAHTGAYARALLGDENHWVRRLPGQLLHNIISHGIARIAEFLVSDNPQVFAYGFVSPALKSVGEDQIIDELRVVIIDANAATAYFTFSSQMRPSLHQFRIYGPRNGLLLDQDDETLIRLKGKRYKSYAEHFLSPLVLSRQYAGNVTGNVGRFLRSEFHPKEGLRFLIESFYGSLTAGRPLPIPYREIVLTARIMDEIFRQIRTPVAVGNEVAYEIQHR